MADGAIEQGYGSKRGSILEGQREVDSLVVVVLRMHYGSELGDGGHPARARSERTALSSVHDLAHRRQVRQRCTSFSSPADL